MSLDDLKNICHKREIKKIAIVDDVFDVPTPDGLNRVNYAKFRQNYNTNNKLRRSVTWVSGEDLEDLPGFDNLHENELAPLWMSTWKPELGGRKLNAQNADALLALFKGHDDDVLGMLTPINELFSLFHNILELSVNVYGTDFDADDIAKAQVVVLDYYLEHNLNKQESLAKVTEVVIAVVKAARNAKRSVPSFLLVSSMPDAVDIEAFSNRAGLMKSRFRFFSKERLLTPRVEDMVSLYDLIDASDRTEIVEQLITDWGKGADQAISAVRERILKLDVSDLVYLDCFRLTHEGTSISNYLLWFLTASLNASVTRNLTKKLWLRADNLKLFSVIDSDGKPDPKTLANTYEGPSEAISHAYSDILFDESRGTGKSAFPAELSNHDLVEGDLFVRMKGKDRKSYKDAEVRLIMTPSCDLLPRMPNQPPSAKSVLLLTGTLEKIEHDTKSNFEWSYSVRVLEHSRWCLLKIKWDFHHPISVDWQKMCVEGPGKMFKRLGRIRDLYFHRIRDEFSNYFTRIGTEVEPLSPRPMSGKVLIMYLERGRKQYRCVMKFTFEERFVWEMGPVRDVGNRKEKYVYQASQKFVRKLTTVLDGLGEENTSWGESAKRSAANLKIMQTYMDLLKPMFPGVRGVDGVVEFKKAMKRKDKLNKSSGANLQIVSFLD